MTAVKHSILSMMKLLCLLLMLLFMRGLTGNAMSCCKVTERRGEYHASCSGCCLRAIPRDFSSDIKVLDLSDNCLHTLRNNSFIQMQNLRTLILDRNNISSIELQAFKGLNRLKRLSLQGNKLNSSLDQSVFQYLTNLSYLNIQRNYFHFDKAYPETSLSYLIELQTLDIDIFESFSFGKGFLNLRNLKALHFHYIGTETVTLKNTSFIGLQRSPITHLEIQFPIKEIQPEVLSPFRMLNSLIVNSRKKRDIRQVLLLFYGLKNTTMDSISLNKNYFLFKSQGTAIRKTDMKYLRSICVRKLSLVQNAISTFAMDAFISWDGRKCLKILDISKNYLYSPLLLLLLRFFPVLTHLYASEQRSIERQIKRRDVRHITRVFIPKTLVYLNLRNNPVNFPLPTIIFNAGNTLQILDISHPYQVTCSGGRFSGLTNLTELYMSGIECSQINPSMLADMTVLQKLMASDCNLGDKLWARSNHLLKGLTYLSEIDLASNNLTDVNVSFFIDQAESLVSLSLSQNKIRHLPHTLLDTCPNLVNLDISRNKIVSLTSKVCEIINKRSNFTINLHGNPLQCTCEQLEFIRWTKTSPAIYDKGSLECIISSGTSKVVQLNHVLEHFEEFETSCREQIWLTVFILLICVTLVVGILPIVTRRFNLGRKIRCCMPNKVLAYKYDVFVSFSHYDMDWFMSELNPWLQENDIEYSCYQKDFDVGVDIVDNIRNAIETSRKVLFLVTYDFIESEWAKHEMEETRRCAFREGRKDTNIVILRDNIQRSEMPKILREIWDSVNCLVWPTDDGNVPDDRVTYERNLFWKRLCRSLKKGSKKPTAAAEESLL